MSRFAIALAPVKGARAASTAGPNGSSNPGS